MCIYIYTSVSPCIKCTEKPWNREYKNMTYRIWVHSLPHSGDLRMHERSDEPFANLVQWNRTCKYKENIVNMERPSNTFGKMRKCQSTELPRPQCWQWAWIENLMPSQIVEHSENDSWQVHCQKKKAYKHNRNGQHSEAARSMKWAVVDMFAKSEFGTREIRSQVEKRKKKHTFDFNIQYFWSRAQEIPKMSFGNLEVDIFGPSWRLRNAEE